MTKKSEAPVGQTGAQNDNSGEQAAVCCPEFTITGQQISTPHPFRSYLKSVLVDALGCVFEVSPSAARFVGRLVTAAWPSFMGL